jgi:hypothetical protein
MNNTGTRDSLNGERVRVRGVAARAAWLLSGRWSVGERLGFSHPSPLRGEGELLIGLQRLSYFPRPPL